MRRFELSEGTSNKFWEIVQEGNSVTTRWGRIGTNGQSKTKEFATDVKARAEYDSLVKEKTGKGYTEVGSSAAPALAAAPRPPAPPAPPRGPVAAPAPPPPAPPTSAPAAAPADSAPATAEVVWTPARRQRVYPRRGSGLTARKIKLAEAFAQVAAELPEGDPGAPRFFSTRQIWIAARDAAAPAERSLIQSVLDRLEGPVPTGPASPAIEGALAALLGQVSYRREPPHDRLVDVWVATGGLSHAILALVEWMKYAPSTWGQGTVELRRGTSTHGDLYRRFEAWQRMRTILATAPQAEWQAARDTAAGLRATASPLERCLISFVFPDVPEWAAEDVRAAIATGNIGRSVGALLSCLDDGALMLQLVQAGQHLSNLIPGQTNWQTDVTGTLLSMVDSAGAGAAAAIAALADLAGSTDDRRTCAEVLAMIRTPESLAALIERLDHKEVQAATTEAALAAPALALPPLAAQAARVRKPHVEAVLTMILRQHEALVTSLLPELPEAARRAVTAMQSRVAVPAQEADAAQLPPILASPPWSRAKQHKTGTVLELEPIVLPDTMDWSSDAEKQQWLRADDWLLQKPTEKRATIALERLGMESLIPLLDGKASDEDVVTAIRDVVAARSQGHWCEAGYLRYLPERMALLAWELFEPSYWNPNYGDPRGWLATAELKALPGLIRVIESQITVGLPLLSPFRSTKIAPLAADAYFRLKKVKLEGQRWLLEHDEYAAVGLVPAAVGKPGKPREAAGAALRMMVNNGREAVVRAAAARYGEAAVAAVEEVLASDPTDQYPARLPKLPSFFQPAGFARPVLAGGAGGLPVPAVETLGTMLAISAADEPYAGVTLVKAACEPGSLARFAWDLFSAWLVAGAPSKENWAFTALGHLGDDECARRLAALVREWPGEAAHARAVTGLDVLASMGTDVALMLLNGIAQKVKFKGLQDRARDKIGQIAESRGLTADELADRLVPDLGLDRDGSLTLDFGPRAFRVGFDEHLRPFVRDGAGKQLPDLPKPGKADDAAVAQAAVERWRALKKDVKTLAGQQILRLELAMGARRRFDLEVFRMFLLEHPLVQHIARRLVWGVYDQQATLVGSFRVSEDLTLADAADDPYQPPEGGQVGVVHALELPGDQAARWGQVFGDYEILQPFRQLGREAFPITDAEREARELMRFRDTTVPTGKVLGLEARGWRRGATQDAGMICWFEKRIPSTDLEAQLELDPGIAVGMVNEYPEQKLGAVKIVKAGSWNAEPEPLSRLDPIVFSELVRDLEGVRS